MFGHGDQHWDVGLSRLLNQLDQPLAPSFQFSKAIDHNKIRSFVDSGLNDFSNACQFVRSQARIQWDPNPDRG